MYWYIAVVTPNTERSCERRLRQFMLEAEVADFDTYVPVQRELHEWPSTGRRVWVDRVVCPCYLFVRCSSELRYRIACDANFILRFMTDRARRTSLGRPDFAVIPDCEMVSFRRMVGDAETPVTIDTSRLHLGSKVRVKSGRLAGLEGRLLRDLGGGTHLVIGVSMLGHARMEMPAALLELVEE